MARIGILGGSFNPPHLAHLICAQQALGELPLDRVVLMPLAIAPHKEAPEDPGTEHRLAMCRLAVADDERLGISDLELKRGGPSYTVDTLRYIHAREPADELTFIVGGDMAETLPAWHEPEAILELATMAVAERAEARRERILKQVGQLTAPPARLRFLAMPRVDISSSLVRERVAAGLPVRYLVTDAVDRYIGDHGLYRGAEHPPVAAPAQAPARPRPDAAPV